VRIRKWLAIVVGTLLLIAACLAVFLWSISRNYVPSDIVDFHPTSFQAKADSAFFFSVGDLLKYSDEINPQAVTLLRGHISNFLVSPDKKKIAAVVNKSLLIAVFDGIAIREVAKVDSIYKDPKPIGSSFFRDNEFQWSRDSTSLYLVKDEYYESKGSQVYSAKGELWRYDIQNGKLVLVLKPFPANTYFLAGNSGVYFSVPTEAGDLRLRYFDGESVKDIGNVNAYEIPKEQLGSGELPFFSFSALEFNQLFMRGAGLGQEQTDRQEELVIYHKPYLSFTQGKGIKGSFHCANLYNSVFLPGGRYFLLNVACGNYEGQLLIDSRTEEYQQLPKDTRVYLALSTDDIPFRITCGGIMPR
jgi:hypothetical protein